ncbi:MAG: PDZ domain-containing protein [Planctomycetaceae bacterium]|nr:PDZ domain-containing protein [Planctomycetaceae bacterium]
MPKRNVIWIAMILALAAALWFARQRSSPPPVQTIPAALKGANKALELIQSNYCGTIDESRLTQGAISGLVSGLDEFSSYVSPQQQPGFQQRLDGRTRGLGLLVDTTAGKALVVGPLPDSPAQIAGIYGGDEIVAVNGRDVREIGPDVESVLAAQLSPVTLTILSAGSPAPREVTLAPADRAIETVVGLYRTAGGQWQHRFDIGRGVAYIRVQEFIQGTAAEFQRILRLVEGAGALVLDLRGNPGGLLPSAVGVASYFQSSGDILVVHDRYGPGQRYKAHPEGASNIPLVVLIDERTASAAEIVAGTLRVHRRAVLVGARTRGKGCVQTMYDLGEGLGQVNLTTAEFLAGGSQPIMRRPGSTRWGIDPDVAVSQHWADQALTRLRRQGSVVPRPLGAATRPASTAGASLYDQLLKTDRQLARAMALAADPAAIHAVLEKRALAPASAAAESRPTAP